MISAEIVEGFGIRYPPRLRRVRRKHQRLKVWPGVARHEAFHHREAEAAIIGRIAQHEYEALGAILEPREALAYERAADAVALQGRRNADRRETHDRHVALVELEDQPGKPGITSDALAVLGDQRQHEIAVGPQPLGHFRFNVAAERGIEQRTHGRGVARPLTPDVECIAHASRVPAFTAEPRRKSSAHMGLPPAFCNSTTRTAPVAQATVSRSSSTVPGSALPSLSLAPLALRSTLMRSLPSSNQAPGNGASPRIWSCTLFHGLPQSIRVSTLS